MGDCFFCKIAKKEIATDLIYENKNIVAFRDINPQAPVHILLIPKLHFSTLNDLMSNDKYLAGNLIYNAAKLAKVRTDCYFHLCPGVMTPSRNKTLMTRAASQNIG